MSSIALKLEHRRAIAKQGEALYPQECRGLLLGHRSGVNKEVLDLMIIREAATPESEGYRYHIPSAKMREGEEMAKAKGLEIIGSFHSHADQPARPSIHDRDLVQPTFSYVLVGVRQGRAHELTSWRLSNDGTAFIQEDIHGA